MSICEILSFVFCHYTFLPSFAWAVWCLDYIQSNPLDYQSLFTWSRSYESVLGAFFELPPQISPLLSQLWTINGHHREIKFASLSWQADCFQNRHLPCASVATWQSAWIFFVGWIPSYLLSLFFVPKLCLNLRLSSFFPYFLWPGLAKCSVWKGSLGVFQRYFASNIFPDTPLATALAWVVLDA